MARMAFEAFGLFLAPFAIFALSLILRQTYPLAVEHWTRGRVSVLTLVGLCAALVGVGALIAVAPRASGDYVPAHVENGVLVPGKIQ